MTAMAAAFQAAGVTTAAPDATPEPNKNNNGKNRKRPSQGRKWDTTKAATESTITWSNEVIGRVSMSAVALQLGDAHVKDGYYWSEIRMKHHEPARVDINFMTNLNEDVVALYSQDGNLIECGTKPIPSLKVPVKWLRKGEKVDLITGNVIPASRGKADDGYRRPHTRVRGRDNADIVFAMKDGCFVDLQPSLLTRGENFKLVMQEVFAGQVVKVTDIANYDLHYTPVQVGDEHFIVVPIWEQFAYPGVDYIKFMPQMGPKLVKMFAEVGAYGSDEELDLLRWVIPMIEPQPGWQIAGVVEYFNAIAGAKVLCQDGKECFVPISKIPDFEGEGTMKDGGFPLLFPRQQVQLNFTEAPRINKTTGEEEITRSATAIQVL